MEFRFRAGEDRPPSYFPPSIADTHLPPQSLGGISSHPDFTFTMPSSFVPTSSSLPQFSPGYFGPKLQSDDPLQNPMMIPVNPMMKHVNPMTMMPVREALRRELEKELIREEIIAGEILRKRELEEEVRRELAYEREVALRIQAQQFSLQGRKHNKKAKEEEFLNKPPCGSNKTEAAELMNQNKVKEWFCDLCNMRATSELDLKNGHLQGKKHKAKVEERELLIASETGGGNNIEAEELVIPKVVKMEWSCNLCQVMAPNEQALTEHLSGKKHKAKEEELLIASKCDEGHKIEAVELINPNKVKNEAAELMNPDKVKKEWSCAPCQVSPPNEQHLNKHLQGKKHKPKEEELLIASKCDEGNKTEAAELMNQNKVKEEWFCDLCNVRATSELDLKNGHLQGKKHKAKVEERELLIASETGGGNNIEAEELVIPKVVKMEWSCDLCQVMAPNEQALTEHLYGKKHKAKEEELLIASKCDEGNKIEAAELMNQNKVKEEWFCDLCNVRATSELNLKNGHLQGKKHKAKVEERELLIASETGGGNNIETEELVIPKVVKMEWSCDLCHVMAPNEQALIEHLYGKKHMAKEEELLIASKCDIGNKTEAAELMNQNKVKEEWFCDLCNVRTTSELDMKNGHLQGKKHKEKAKERELLITSETGGGNNIEAEELVIPKVVKMEWSCNLCHVMAPNEQALIQHLYGKKHMAKEEELLIASKCDEGNKIEAAELINPNKVKNEAAELMNPNKVKKEWSCALCQVSPPNKQHLNKHLQGKKHKAKEEALLIASKPASSFTTSKKADNSNTLEKQGVTSNEQQKKLQQQVPKEAKEIVSKKSLLPYCEHCKLQCNSESMLASHLRGKKHLSRMWRLKAMLSKVNEESRADWVAKTMEENIKPSGNNNKGPALNKDDKSNKLVNKVMTTSSSKWLQKLQVGQCMQQVPKKQSKAVKNLPVHCVLCNVECYGEHMLGSHLRGKKHLARMKELESHKEVSVNHTEDANAGVTFGRNEESEVDVNKEVEIIEVKQSIGSHQDEQEVGSERTSIGNHQDEQEMESERTSIGNHQDEQEVESERTSIGNHQDEQEVESERTSIGNHQDEQEVESERTSIGNHQDEQVVASETMDGVPVPSTEEVANRMEDGARKNFSLGNLTHAIIRFLFIFSVVGY